MCVCVHVDVECVCICVCMGWRCVGEVKVKNLNINEYCVILSESFSYTDNRYTECTSASL